MPTVRDMMRKKSGQSIISISPDATVLDALRMMSEHNTGALLVIREDDVDGIISERDCVRKVELAGRAAAETQVREIMTAKVIYVEAAQDVEECMALMIDKNIRHLPVYDGERLVGLVSVRDVLREIVDVQKFMISELERYIMGGGR